MAASDKILLKGGLWTNMGLFGGLWHERVWEFPWQDPASLKTENEWMRDPEKKQKQMGSISLSTDGSQLWGKWHRVMRGAEDGGKKGWWHFGEGWGSGGYGNGTSSPLTLPGLAMLLACVLSRRGNGDITVGTGWAGLTPPTPIQEVIIVLATTATALHIVSSSASAAPRSPVRRLTTSLCFTSNSFHPPLWRQLKNRGRKKNKWKWQETIFMFHIWKSG